MKIWFGWVVNLPVFCPIEHLNGIEPLLQCTRFTSICPSSPYGGCGVWIPSPSQHNPSRLCCSSSSSSQSPTSGSKRKQALWCPSQDRFSTTLLNAPRTIRVPVYSVSEPHFVSRRRSMYCRQFSSGELPRAQTHWNLSISNDLNNAEKILLVQLLRMFAGELPEGPAKRNKSAFPPTPTKVFNAK